MHLFLDLDSLYLDSHKEPHTHAYGYDNSIINTLRSYSLFIRTALFIGKSLKQNVFLSAFCGVMEYLPSSLSAKTLVIVTKLTDQILIKNRIGSNFLP